MASRFQAAALVASPCYPEAIAWSEENLIAVASGHLVTIINPALPSGPRGSITIPASEPYAIGRIKGGDLLSCGMLPTALARDRRPCVRSVSWSSIGMAPNAGCLLAVCTIEGRVKLYRPPYYDFCAEWVEVMDISDELYRYLCDSNFEEPLPETLEKKACADFLLNPCTTKERKRRERDAPIHITEGNETWHNEVSNSRNDKNVDAYKCAEREPKRLDEQVGTQPGKRKKDAPDGSAFSPITAEQYSSRDAHLSSLVVAWSPALHSSAKEHDATQSDLNRFSILAVGGKSGKISMWKISAPQCYSLENRIAPSSAILVQLLQAHSSWVTTIKFAVVGSSSNSWVVLASGSSDGSVKIWAWDCKETEPGRANSIEFSLLKEVLSANPIPVSVVSLSVSNKSSSEVLVALGQGSGFLQVWRCDVFSNAFSKVGSYKGHDYIVTDLVWAFDDCCLYSCGQDNYIHGWILCNSSLHLVPLPANTPDIRSATELPDVFLSCQGVAVSPGNLALALVRNLDVDHLNPMYQASTQRAVVEFFWIGGQKLEAESNISLGCSNKASSGFAASELVSWESNILWSLKQFESSGRPLVLWEIVVALSSFKQSIPTYVDRLLLNWLSSTFLGARMDSVNEVSASICRGMSKFSSRKLHLLNIISRRVILLKFRSDEINSGVDLEGLICAKGEQFALWLELLFSSERELRERLVGLSFSAFLSSMSHSSKDSCGPGFWCPVGVALMEQWVAISYDHIKNPIKELASEVGKRRRLQPSCTTFREEQCGYCSASVSFDSPEGARCRGTEFVDGVVQNHQLARCAASMQVCPTTPAWLCKCCGRSVSNLAPPALFTMPCFPEDFKPLAESSSAEVVKPWCPFCGILLQRLQPDFLPSVSPV